MRKPQSAFTLLEIMLVVTIIALLLAAAIRFMSPNLDVAKSVRVTGDIQSISTSLLAYNGLNGFYPTTEQGLQALVTSPSTEPKPARWQQFMEQVPTDPWGMPYIYKCPGLKNPTKYDLYSAGPDRLPDTADDNWGK
ncbi:MAG: type II secretion system major pseudopilin GspG [Verrucomicrobiota bacterium]|nr:type II secretion system major pseudopilin GspG [Verrucomicrobiota bacterium]